MQDIQDTLKPDQDAPMEAIPSDEADAGLDGHTQPGSLPSNSTDGAVEVGLGASARADAAAPSDDPGATVEDPTVRPGFIPRASITAFVATQGVGEALTRASADRRMSRTALEVVAGGLEAAADHFASHPMPDLILAETKAPASAILPMLESLAQSCPPGTRLILIGHANDVALYRRLMRAGVGEYLVAPVEPLQLIDALAQVFGEAAADEGLGSVTAFMGARGGAGSSTVALNTATAMVQHLGMTVLLTDLDLAWGTAALDLDLDPAQGVRDALEAGERLDEELLDRLIAQRDERFSILASPASLEFSDSAETAEEQLERLVTAARKVTPHLLLDLPHQWSPMVRRALLLADEIVLTVTPDLAALRNARNLLADLKQARANDSPPKLVLNQSGMPKRKDVDEEDFKRIFHVAPAARIPFDAAAFSAAANGGKPVVETRANAVAAGQFRELAALLTGRIRRDAKPRGLAGLAKRLLRAS